MPKCSATAWESRGRSIPLRFNHVEMTAGGINTNHVLSRGSLGYSPFISIQRCFLLRRITKFLHGLRKAAAEFELEVLLAVLVWPSAGHRPNWENFRVDVANA
jgi:hypothetical protein